MSKLSEIVQSKKYYGGMTLPERLKKYHIPAISIIIVENFEICESYTYGTRRRWTKEQVTEATLFQGASTSKPVFAAAVMRLAQLGTLDIDADISEYLDDYEVPTFDQQKYKITLRQLLSHHAGLNLHGFIGYSQGKKIPTVNQILTGTAPANHPRLELIQKPRTGFRYSGGGYVLAQKIVTDLCQLDFCELMNELILTPFLMKNSTFAQPLPPAKINEMAYGYNFLNLQIRKGYRIMPELAAAGLWTTPSDLARFGIEIMKALKDESPFLEKELAYLMIKKASKNSTHGAGFAVERSKKGLTFGHGGTNLGYHSNMSFCPRDGSGIVVMQNSDLGRRICQEVTNAFKKISGWS